MFTNNEEKTAYFKGIEDGTKGITKNPYPVESRLYGFWESGNKIGLMS